jgi:hypothetical protein
MFIIRMKIIKNKKITLSLIKNFKKILRLEMFGFIFVCLYTNVLFILEFVPASALFVTVQ